MQAAAEPRDAKFRGAGALFSANGRGLKGSESRDMALELRTLELGFPKFSTHGGPRRAHRM